MGFISNVLETVSGTEIKQELLNVKLCWTSATDKQNGERCFSRVRKGKYKRKEKRVCYKDRQENKINQLQSYN